jgi:DNA end-binding protein Ku
LRSLRQEFDMPPPRPHWKGYLKLSLVTCPIALYSASSSTEKVAFRQINKKTGNRLKQQLIDEETGNVVDAADKGRGYEVDKGIYLGSTTTRLTRSQSKATIRSISTASSPRRKSTSAISIAPTI